MKIVLAPNAFKESLSASEIAQAMRAGIQAVDAGIECVTVPLADGGDGTTEALVSARQGELVEIPVHDPLMRPVRVQYGFIDNGSTAVIEMASASGLWRLKPHEKNPLKTTTFGTGEMIRDALERGVQHIVIGIGGSATTDAGIGMAAALGYQFLDDQGRELEPIGASMNSIAQIKTEKVHPRLRNVQIHIASDVKNPLLGREGAAPVYGPQKGADPVMVQVLEEGLANVAQRMKDDLGADVADIPGAGAAGGLGAGLVAFCGAELRSGFDLIADYAQLDQALAGADLLITGEGKIDEQTPFGKVPAGAAQRAKQQGVPAIALAGSIVGDLTALHELGLISVFTIMNGPISLEEAMKNTRDLMKRTTEQVIRLWIAKKQHIR
ncbi:MAG: glycerate kinase [bacterium]|jgi:glycerate kinase